MRTQSRLYRLLSLLTLPVIAGALLLAVDLILHPLEPGSDSPLGSVWGRWLFGFVLPAVNIVIGVLCMRRAPGNAVGPLLVIYGAGLTAQSLPASFDPAIGGILFYVGGYLVWGGFFVLVLLFPNGRPHPRWMGWFLALLVTVLSCSVPMYIVGSPRFFAGVEDVSRWIENPYFIPAIEPLNQRLIGIANRTLLPLTIFALPFSVFMRYRAGSPKEKAQMRWMLWGLLGMLLLWFAQPLAASLGMLDLSEIVGVLGTALVFMLPPFAIGNAILRHNLYDIDIIIRKTLTYSVLTAILAALYFAGIILAQQVFRTVTGQTSDLAIVLSTLLIAALFSPLRRRIQETIDRQFFRRRYNAEQTVARFNQTLRDEVDIDTLQGELVAVVNETMQPAKIALWVQPASTNRTN